MHSALSKCYLCCAVSNKGESNCPAIQQVEPFNGMGGRATLEHQGATSDRYAAPQGGGSEMLSSIHHTAHREVSDMALVRVSELSSLTALVQTLISEVSSLQAIVKPLQVYDNKAIKQLLGIQDKLLKKYRDDGLLGYSQVGDKYWYTRNDIANFLSSSKVEPLHAVA